MRLIVDLVSVPPRGSRLREAFRFSVLCFLFLAVSALGLVLSALIVSS